MAAKKPVRKVRATKPVVQRPATKKAAAKTRVRGAKALRRTASPAREPRPAAAGAAQVQHAVEQFLYRQAELLDGKRWQDYIELFTDDGVYWMPADPAHTHWDGVPAVFAEDRNLMTVRMKRVLHPDAWSQRPLWGTNHVVGNVIVDRVAPNGDVVVRSRFHMLELRRDSVRHFAGSYVHHLRRTRDGYRISLQRVDMTNAQAAYEYVLQVWV